LLAYSIASDEGYQLGDTEMNLALAGSALTSFCIGSLIWRK
jgi:hypothetical protein